MKKRSKLIIIIIIILCTTAVILFSRREKDYTVVYKVDGYEISEQYNKNTKSYYFSTTMNNKIYEIAITNDNLHKKQLINNIDLISNENDECLYMKSEVLNTYPTCHNGEEFIAYSLSDIKDDSFYKLKEYNEKKDNFGNINIFSLVDKTIAIWNHFGFDYISNDKKEPIKLIKKDSYLDNYSFAVDNYIILPDYDDEYSFNKVYLINLKNGDTNTWKLDYSINYDFYILGIKDKKAYLIDKKAKIEYELNPKNKSIDLISKNGQGKIWTGKWEDESIVKLANESYSFKEDSAIDYYIKDNRLFASISNDKKEIELSKQQVDKIINIDGLNIYYLSKNKLYYFSFYSGEILCLEYNEFEFNKGLSIYIY